MQVSAEIASMVEQRDQRLRNEELARKRRKEWNERVRRAIDLLTGCTVADDSAPAVLVRERWVPAARAVLACAPAAKLKRIYLPINGIATLFRRLLDDPESKVVQGSVAVDLAFVFERVGVTRAELFEPFRALAMEFEGLTHMHLTLCCPKWLQEDAPEIPSAIEADPAVQEIRGRLGHRPNAMKQATEVYLELCRDKREWVPRAALRKMGLPPTAVDRAPKSPADVRNKPRAFTRVFLLQYVRSTWTPRSP